jgi:hypothetical protein
MRALRLVLGMLAVAALPLLAQVTVEVTQEQQQFLPGEEMQTAVRITNRSGQPLHLGQGQDWLTFTVQGREEEVVQKHGEVAVEGEFTLESSRVATKRVDLEPYFELNHSGHYSVIASVRLKEWNQVITSPPKGFDIIEGSKLWEQDIGVPAVEGVTNAAPEVRKFILQQANFLKTQLRLYVRLTDPTGTKTFKVFAIGPMVSFGRPEPQVDKFSNMHLLYQEGPRSFVYTVINPEGEVIARRTYDYAETRPRLQPDADGRVLVSGGVRRLTKSDVPPSKEMEPAKAEPKPPAAPGEMMPPGP